MCVYVQKSSHIQNVLLMFIPYPASNYTSFSTANLLIQTIVHMKVE